MNKLLALCLSLTALEADDRPCVVVVVGAPGTPEYSAQFEKWANLWQAAAKQGKATSVRIGSDDKPSGLDRDRLRATLAENATGKQPLWVVLIGHGTFDGKEAKFNLRGPDISDKELADWLAPVQRPLVVIHCGSSSGTFINKLSGPNRIVLTATKSGDEQNYARFGQYLAESIADVRSDLDKDGQVSLLEAYLTASGKVAEYYKSHAQLATEHALLDDNGDKLGTPADWFHGVRATKRARDGAPLDGPRAHQIHLLPSDNERKIPPGLRERRDALELKIAALQADKEKLDNDLYYTKLEPLMVELAKLYREIQTEPGHGH
jgi:hypothetical protein